jgi:hypothetical protein
MSETTKSVIYQLKVLLLGISSMIWCRLLVCSTSTITDLHHILQITMGWPDDHLHLLRIHAKQYGIASIGGLSSSNNPDTIRLKYFYFRINERFLYEYDFTDDWQHQVRVEAFLDPDPRKKYSLCINGRRACPPEDCGGTRAFIVLGHKYSLGHIMLRLLEMADDGENKEDHYEELRELQYWLTALIAREQTKRLDDYAHEEEIFMWE